MYQWAILVTTVVGNPGSRCRPRDVVNLGKSLKKPKWARITTVDGRWTEAMPIIIKMVSSNLCLCSGSRILRGKIVESSDLMNVHHKF